jgi:ParB family chromosome partitioning protein
MGGFMKLEVGKIFVRNRVREEVGSLATLVSSMKQYGLINPITVDSNNELISGHRRLLAAKELGWKEIECNVMDNLSTIAKLEIEMHENITRKDFTDKEIDKGNTLKKKLELKGFKKFLSLLKRFFIWLAKLFEKKK